MEILNKKIKCNMLTNIKEEDCMIIHEGGSYYLLSNDEQLDCASFPPATSRRGYKYSLGIGFPSHDLEKALKDWKIRDIKLLRKLNHEL